MAEARSKRIQKERGPGPVRWSCWPWTEETVLSQTRENQCDCVSKFGELASLIPELEARVPDKSDRMGWDLEENGGVCGD